MTQNDFAAITDDNVFRRIYGARLEETLRSRFARDHLQVIEAFTNSFNSLPRDTYLPRKFGSRKRRFSRFDVNMRSHEFIELPDSTFVQSLEDNPLFGGLNRSFAPLESKTRNSGVLVELIRFAAQAADPTCPRWLVNAHQFRVEATNAPAFAAPEGIHRDGHDFIAIVLIARVNICGGNNIVYDDDLNTILEVTLSNRFDMLVVNDRKSYHDVTPFFVDADNFGYRDTFVFDLNRRTTNR